MTNGEKLKEVFPNIEIVAIVPDEIVVTKKLDGPDAAYTRNSFRYEWWYAEYKEPITENCIACKYGETEEEDGEHCKKCLEGDSQFELADDVMDIIRQIPSVTPQESKTKGSYHPIISGNTQNPPKVKSAESEEV